jgi:hypothetical protein
MIDQETRQSIVDEEHLKMLSIGYVVSGCMSALFSLMGLLYAGMGVMVFSLGSAQAKDAAKSSQGPPVEMAWFFGVFGLIMFLVLVAVALCKFKAAHCIKKRTGRTFCMVIAAISCFGIPYGTLLGVFTFMVLSRPSVAKLFDPSPAA